MGVGYERDIVTAVRAGVDMFDCVLPTRNGRNASAFTRTGAVRFRNAKYALDDGPIEMGCDCLACKWSTAGERTPFGEGKNDSTFTRAYIRHLFLSEEMLGPILVSLHNVRHFQRLMADLRATIRDEAAGGVGGGNGGSGGEWEAFFARWPVALGAVAEAPSDSTPGAIDV
jgi:queuine tRNA-ribosyltransferase